MVKNFFLLVINKYTLRIKYYSLSFIFVLLPLPSRYRLEVNVPHRSSTFLIVPQRYPSFLNVTHRSSTWHTITHRSSTWHTVTYRYSALHTVTHPYTPLPTVTLTLLQIYSSLLQRVIKWKNTFRMPSIAPKSILNFVVIMFST